MADPLDTIAEDVKSSIFASNGNFEDWSFPRNAKDCENETLRTFTTRDVLAQQWRLAMHEMLNLQQIKCARREEVLNYWFERLWTLYTDETRHYHTVVHVEEMCHYFRLLLSMQEHLSSAFPADTRTEPQDSPIVILAIFFHDAIYDARSSTNEEDSVKLFESFACEAGIDQHRKEQIASFILATKTHDVAQEQNPSSVLCLFLDLDMAVLGKQETAYMQYSALIRKEFCFIPHDVYCEKRADILETFLQQPRIYGTSVMYKALEDRARANVRKEIKSLRQGVIPCPDER